MNWCALLSAFTQGLEHMAQIFKTAKFLVCYDLNTFTTVHAALSGCITIVAPQKGISRSEQLNGSWYQKYGVAYGYTDIPRALRTLPLLREEIESHKTKSILTIKSFIKDIKKLTDWKIAYADYFCILFCRIAAKTARADSEKNRDSLSLGDEYNWSWRVFSRVKSSRVNEANGLSM